jgi:hypothetical protein
VAIAGGDAGRAAEASAGRRRTVLVRERTDLGAAGAEGVASSRLRMEATTYGPLLLLLWLLLAAADSTEGEEVAEAEAAAAAEEEITEEEEEEEVAEEEGADKTPIVFI